ncbi:MAG TPA: YceI family protein [Pedobacter sp.]|nr:YceI family protein [Pedobacter sp.]
MNLKKIVSPLVLMLFLFASAFSVIYLQHWAIGNDYAVRFSGKYADGVFKRLKGDVVFRKDDLSMSRFDVIIDVNSIETGNKLKNKHAKGVHWFDAVKYPFIHFVSSSIIKTDTGYVASGELDLHGIKKPVNIPFKFEKTGDSAVFIGSFKLDRGDFGIGKSKGKSWDSTDVEVIVPVKAIP